MGPHLWEVCEGSGPTHLHGTKTVGILTESQAGVQFSRLFRSGLGPEGSTMMEGSGDVSGRWVDIWTAFTEPTLKYTLPDKLYWGTSATPEKLPDSLLYGHVPIINFARPDRASRALDSSEEDPEARASLRQYLALRKKLAAAPGYPDGFRDQVGLSVSGSQDVPELLAKVFRRLQEGITVVYYAKSPLQAELAVDGRALDNPKLGVRRKRVRLDKNEVGIWIIR